MIRRASSTGAALLALALVACAPEPPAPDSAPAPVAPRPKPAVREPQPNTAELRRARVEAARAAAAAGRSEDSQTIAGYFRGVEEQLLARGRLRTDSGTSEGLPTAAALAATFAEVALRSEYTRVATGLTRSDGDVPLRRWEVPVRIRLEFGAAVPPDQRVRDRDVVANYAARLARVTGHDIALATEGGNFLLHVVTEDERRALSPRLAAEAPGVPAADIAALTRMSPQTACTVFAYGRAPEAGYTTAVAVIRAELPDLSRTACLHEEIAQGLGLPNDSGTSRPSIFNDDDEFAYLTRHDELLLQILYDPALRPGMTAAEVRPIVEQIAQRLVGAGT
ncbi:DUF2927 domain-containing protein [Paracoccus sp. S-4012]|uniref:DUF2927 domain-containing protein n=1 Tax=Paracoccus sp. S-4012 TaxID=2665648 RepID=UPI0012AFB054|nr:DUF2927 domain-containing protein [Paracoccus sp. S-4012]MRX49539.1 DUF2927 domain-containing protein [Paracoccus sp. S-4012]